MHFMSRIGNWNSGGNFLLESRKTKGIHKTLALNVLYTHVAVVTNQLSGHHLLLNDAKKKKRSTTNNKITTSMCHVNNIKLHQCFSLSIEGGRRRGEQMDGFHFVIMNLVGYLVMFPGINNAVIRIHQTPRVWRKRLLIIILAQLESLGPSDCHGSSRQAALLMFPLFFQCLY